MAVPSFHLPGPKLSLLSYSKSNLLFYVLLTLPIENPTTSQPLGQSWSKVILDLCGSLLTGLCRQPFPRPFILNTAAQVILLNLSQIMSLFCSKFFEDLSSWSELYLKSSIPYVLLTHYLFNLTSHTSPLPVTLSLLNVPWIVWLANMLKLHSRWSSCSKCLWGSRLFRG